MTICIAAIYGAGDGVVLISDRMVTAHFPIGYEFEHAENTKISTINVDDDNSFYALMAGDVLCGNEILNYAKNECEQRELISAYEFVEIIRSAYQTVRLNSIIRTELEPRGLDLETYYSTQQRLAPNIIHMIDRSMKTTDLAVEIIIAGKVKEKFNVFTVHNPGVIRENTSVGYSTIGSGAPHAIYSLIEAGYSTSMKKEDVIELVKKAKERSQVAPGVGIATNLVVTPTEDTENA
ncbi:MAG: hypothetical protein OXG88_03745 [Gammaproteobacteria bacterium]|nr:hypothetical protein [Gammaproteobacteria bacterium]